MVLPYRMLFLAALLAGASYYLDHWLETAGPLHVVWKGAGVSLLALWARLCARDFDGKLIAAVLALGALGDVLLETHGLVTGAVAFLIGHALAVLLYLRNRRGPAWSAIPAALAVAAAAWAVSGDIGATVYAAGLGAMAGAALASRFALAGVGAILFVVSDLLIFARMGPLAGSQVPGLLIWLTYFAGQALIAWSVVVTLAKERRA